MAELTAQLQALPTTPGVYFFYDHEDRLLYIGKSVNLRARVRSYFRPNGGHTRRTERLKDEAARLEVQRCGTELEALLVESKLIKSLQPLYNVLGRSYRHYPFIRIPDEPFAEVELTYQLQDDGASYYGPFPGEYRAREALDAMRPLFKWRSCRPMPKRPCFEASIGRCTAPCIGAVDAETYRANLEDLKRFLTGDGAERLRELEAQMHAASEALMFERAGILRDRLAMLRPLAMRQQALQSAISELDCLVVLPAAEAGQWLWLVVRRGRLVHSEAAVTPRMGKGLKRRLGAVLEAEPPSLTVHQSELDEINIIAGWLHKHRDAEQAIGLAGRCVDEVVEAGLAVMREVAQRKVAAEAAPTRVIAGPEA